ncbi:alpha-ketoacid dehydrogenase subunit beta [Facklamia sp. P9177]|uniref:alpha-ketoacid dehydrogenase subunit beta n=1 Tax=Facklamia sp. P9177 TaxID=3421945 RepID=UPI003D183E0E
MAKLTMIEAITEALANELRTNDRTLVFGEDVGKNGGVFRATQGLQEEFGEERVMDTPLAESGISGMAIGLALEGFRPIPEIQFNGFVFETMDSVVAQAARTRYRMGASRNLPITFRSPFGGGVHTPELHADSLEGLLAQSPGLKVVIPSNPYDAKGLLISAIRDNDPVYFLEHMKLYRSFREEVPEGEYTVPLGKAKVVKEGTDLTLIAYGAMVQESVKAAEKLAKEGVDVEVLDLRTVQPLDIETIIASVEKTGKVIVVQEAQRQAGVGSKVIAEVSERAVLSLKAPIGFVAAPDTIFPFGMAERDWLPNAEDIVAKAKELEDF